MTNEGPRLSEETIRQLRRAGLDPEEMSAEQLEALESAENPGKSHWVAKPFVYVGGFLGLMAVLSLVTGDWDLLAVYGILGLLLIYVGYRIQLRIAGRRFVEASIKRDLEKREQQARKI